MQPRASVSEHFAKKNCEMLATETRGTITGPAGRSAAIVTAWIVLRGEEFARFVSAYPED
jgi:hypothetical protein